LNTIKNIIFDLGGVILDINYQATIDAFVKMGIKDFSNLYSQKEQKQIFDDFEIGKITSNQFISSIQSLSQNSISKDKIITAWNAMLLEINTEKLDYLLSLKERFRIFLLSNTNEIHISKFEAGLVKKNELKKFYNCFEKVHYSSRLSLRKPNLDCFKKVLNINKLNASETIFIDDSKQHIEGALKCGIKGYLFPQNYTIQDWLPDIIQPKHH
tara:strand:- start:359 stop:997 length:639 start_codon:yes stop_codon:yes gene_type:complete